SALPSQCAATQLRWIAANRLNMQDPLRQCQCQVPAMLWQQALSIRHSSISFLQSAATFAKDFRDAMRLLPHLIFSRGDALCVPLIFECLQKSEWTDVDSPTLRAVH